MQFCDENGLPLVNGRVKFLIPGTSEYKSVYANADESLPYANPVVLDSGGYCNMYAKGTYKLVLQRGVVPNPNPLVDDDWLTINTIEKYIASVETLDDASLPVVAVVATNQDLPYVDTTKYIYCVTKGHTVAGDGGGGSFWLNPSDSTNVADDGVFYVTDSAVGRWTRAIGAGEALTPMMWGAMPNSASTVSVRIGKMIAFAQTHPRNSHIIIPTGTYPCAGALTFSGNITVDLDYGANFSPTAGNSNVTVSTEGFNPRGSWSFCSTSGYGRMELTWTNGRTPDLAWFNTTASAGAPTLAITRALNPSFNTSTALTVSKAYTLNLTVALSATNHKILFVDNGSFTVNNYVLSLLKGYENHTASSVFNGTISNLSVVAQSCDIADFVAGSSITGAQLDNIQTCVTQGGSQSGEINWSKVITISSDSSIGSYGEFISNTFSGTGVISTGSHAVTLGWINASPTRNCFSSTSAALTLTNKVVYLNWWSTVHQSFDGALQCAINTGAMVDLNNNLVSTSNGFTIPDTWQMRNGYISSTIAGTGTQGLTSSPARISKINLQNIDWDGHSLYNAERVIFVTAYDTKLESCTFRNCVVSVTGLVTATDVNFPNNKNNLCSISNNRFDYARLNLQQPDNFVCKGNWFGMETVVYAKLNSITKGIRPGTAISAAISGGLIKNFIFTDNDFAVYTPENHSSMMWAMSGIMSCGNAIVDSSSKVIDNTGYVDPDTLNGTSFVLSTEVDILIVGLVNHDVTVTHPMSAPTAMCFAGSHPSKRVLSLTHPNNSGTAMLQKFITQPVVYEDVTSDPNWFTIIIYGASDNSGYAYRITAKVTA